MIHPGDIAKVLLHDIQSVRKEIPGWKWESEKYRYDNEEVQFVKGVFMYGQGTNKEKAIGEWSLS